MYEKYFVYVDDGHDCYKLAIAAVSEDAARAWCAGTGEVIAVKNVTKEYPISADKVSDALRKAEFGQPEIDWIVRLLREFEVAE